jgi:NADH-quinone oxidoreductase subunit L
MLRLCIVAFMGPARDHGAEHAREAGFTMALPLLVLAVMAVISGYGFIANDLVPFNGFHAHGFSLGLPFYVSMGSLAAGILLALAVYGLGNRTKDPLAGNCISKALRNRLYIDTLYDNVLIGGIQQVFANIIQFLDSFIIRGIICKGLVWLTVRIGYVCSWIQCGSLRAYTLVTGIGLIILILLLVYQF